MEGDVNWSKCIICGTWRVAEVLRCPKSSRGHTEEEQLEHYEKVRKNIHILWDKGIPLPSVTLPRTLTAKSMYDNSAKWHIPCSLKFSDTKVQQMLRSHERRQPEAEPQPAPESQAPKRSRSNYDNKLCIFCQSVKKVSSKDGPAEPESLYNVASMDFGTKHRDMAAEIDDPILVLRMDRGDLIADEGKYHRSCQVGFLNRWKKFQSEKISSKDKTE